VRTIEVHPDSLGGLPADWVGAFASGAPGEDGLVTVAITAANFYPVVAFAESAGLRERAARAFFSQGHPQNRPLLDSLRVLRHEIAGLLGFDSWAHYSLASKMAGSPERVRAFLDEVDEASGAAAEREVAALLAARQRVEPGATSVPYDQTLHWSNEVRQREYGFDEQAMRAYFPYTAVRDGILEAYEEVFGLEFRPAPDAPAWSPEARGYEVFEGGALVGRFVLDMHPREGKFGHFAAMPLRLGGGRLPEAALLCNFPGGTGGDPGLLTPGLVRTFFHEFGHLIHFLSAGQQPVVGAFESDFVEAPSQLLEEWAMDDAVLRRFARHHETGEPIPADLVASYRRADGFGRALRARENLWLSDLALHLHLAPPEAEPTGAVERRAGRFLVTPVPDYLHIGSRLPHLHPYSSNYYTYAWSEVIARDLLTGFDRTDLLSPEAGRRYRGLVLGPTGTAPSAVLVERFLGRPFNAEAWRLWLHEGGRE
jgi:thimet oligopeptidase